MLNLKIEILTPYIHCPPPASSSNTFDPKPMCAQDPSVFLNEKITYYNSAGREQMFCADFSTPMTNPWTAWNLAMLACSLAGQNSLTCQDYAPPVCKIAVGTIQTMYPGLGIMKTCIEEVSAACLACSATYNFRFPLSPTLPKIY